MLFDITKNMIYDLLGPPVEFFFDHLELCLMALFALIVVFVSRRISLRDAWIVIAHRTVRLVLAASVLATVVHCVDAYRGGGARIGSHSVGVRRGANGVAAEFRSTPIDPDRVPSARMLNARGITAATSTDHGILRPAFTRVEFRAPVPQSPRGAAAAVVISGAIALVPWFMGLLAIERILGRARRGEPFSPRNVRDLRWLAFAVSGAVYIALAVDDTVARWILDDNQVYLMLGEYEQAVGDRFTIPFAPLAAGALVLALAEVWRYGIALQRDAEATI